jgi:hypothetical protein
LVFSFAEQLLAASRAAAAGAGKLHLAGRALCLFGVLTAASAAAAAAEDPAEQEALTAKGVAAEIMDTAVEHCRRGESAQALSMFAAIREQLDPPPAIARLIRDLEATGCNRLPVASGAALRLQAGGGWDSNVSQGITARSLVLGSGDNILELELDPSYRPRSSAFVQTSVDYSVLQPATGIEFQAVAGHRKNDRAPTFDLSSFSAALSREFKLPRGNLRGQLEVSEVWLGRSHYQRSQSAAARWIDAQPTGVWLATLNATAVQYLTQPSQNSFQWELGMLGERRLSAAQSVHAGVALQYDHATRTRPGGDRRGFQLSGGTVVLAQGWRFKPQLSFTYWNSAEVFAPGLLDVHRHNRLTQATFQAERPLSAQTSLVLEWRGRWARDTVVLYRYQAQVVSATLAHRF